MPKFATLMGAHCDLSVTAQFHEFKKWASEISSPPLVLNEEQLHQLQFMSKHDNKVHEIVCSTTKFKTKICGGALCVPNNMKTQIIPIVIMFCKHTKMIGDAPVNLIVCSHEMIMDWKRTIQWLTPDRNVYICKYDATTKKIEATLNEKPVEEHSFQKDSFVLINGFFWSCAVRPSETECKTQSLMQKAARLIIEDNIRLPRYMKVQSHTTWFFSNTFDPSNDQLLRINTFFGISGLCASNSNAWIDICEKKETLAAFYSQFMYCHSDFQKLKKVKHVCISLSEAERVYHDFLVASKAAPTSINHFLHTGMQDPNIAVLTTNNVFEPNHETLFHKSQNEFGLCVIDALKVKLCKLEYATVCSILSKTWKEPTEVMDALLTCLNYCSEHSYAKNVAHYDELTKFHDSFFSTVAIYICQWILCLYEYAEHSENLRKDRDTNTLWIYLCVDMYDKQSVIKRKLDIMKLEIRRCV